MKKTHFELRLLINSLMSALFEQKLANERQEYRFKQVSHEREVGEWLSKIADFHYLVTLTFCEKVSADQAKRMLKIWRISVSRRLFSQKSGRKDIKIVPILEKTNIARRFHYHLLIVKPKNDKGYETDQQIKDLMKNKWENLKLSGKAQLHANKKWFEVINKTTLKKLTNYSSKQWHDGDCFIDEYNMTI